MYIPPPTPPPHQHALVAQLLQHALGLPSHTPARPPHQATPDPVSVFGRMRKSLPDATRSGITSHQQELIRRFMRNAQASAGRGVRK